MIGNRIEYTFLSVNDSSDGVQRGPVAILMADLVRVWSTSARSGRRT